MSQNNTVIFDGVINNDTTNWGKSELRIGLQATLEEVDWRTEQLGEMARENMLLTASIRGRDQTPDLALELTGVRSHRS